MAAAFSMLLVRLIGNAVLSGPNFNELYRDGLLLLNIRQAPHNIA